MLSSRLNASNFSFNSLGSPNKTGSSTETPFENSPLSPEHNVKFLTDTPQEVHRSATKTEQAASKTQPFEWHKAQLQTIGASKNPNTLNTADTDLIARTVMRYPNPSVRSDLNKLHDALKTILLPQSLEGLRWLLGGSSTTARGGFGTDPEKLRQFLKKNPQTIPSSALITKLSALIAAISYRSIKREGTIPPFAPETVAQHKMFRSLQNVLALKIMDYDTRYPDGRNSSRDTYLSPETPAYDQEKEFTTQARAEISDDSDLEETSPLPDRLPQMIFFKTKAQGTTKSWTWSATEGQIPIRLGISGSALLSLRTIKWLLTETSDDLFDSDWLVELDPSRLQDLAGALLVPVYIRGDYHSIAETGAAVHHYMKPLRRNSTKQRYLSPQKALSYGLNLMIRATDESYRVAVHQVAYRIISNTRDVGYTTELY